MLANQYQLNNALKLGYKAGNALNLGNAELCHKLIKAFWLGQKHFINVGDMLEQFNNDV